MFHLALAQIMQARRPLAILREVFRHPLREQNVTGVAAIHHPLRRIDPGAGDVRPPAHIRHFAHRTAVNSHPHRNFRMLPERFGHLERAARRLLRAMTKNQRHPVAGRQFHHPLVRRLLHLRRREHNFAQLTERLALFFDQQLRVANDIDEEDMPDLKLKMIVRFGFHGVDLVGKIASAGQLRRGLFLPAPQPHLPARRGLRSARSIRARQPPGRSAGKPFSRKPPRPRGAKPFTRPPSGPPASSRPRSSTASSSSGCGNGLRCPRPSLSRRWPNQRPNVKCLRRDPLTLLEARKPPQ